MLEYKQLIDTKGALTGDGVVRLLEQKFVELLGGNHHCLSVMNATSGLMALLSCLPQGQVIAPLFTSPATYAAIRHAGHVVKFCDIDPQSLCLSPVEVQKKRNKKVRAIITVNIFGHQSHLPELRVLASDLGAMLILDAAQSLETCQQKPVSCAVADAIVFSLGPGKQLGCYDGGIIAVKSIGLWEMLIRKTQHPYRQILDVPAQAPDFEHYNYRINPNTASSALIRLGTAFPNLRQFHPAYYNVIERLNETGEFEPLSTTPGILIDPVTVLPIQPNTSNWMLYDLPIPVRLQMADELNLPETLRQFKFRRVFDPVNSPTPESEWR